MEHTKHIIRAVLLLIVAAVSFVIIRHFLIPETFGAYGHFRAASVTEHAAPAPVHGGVEACADCHDEPSDVWSAGKHVTVSCEVCHAPLGVHVRDEEQVAAMPVDKTFRLCGRCHERLVARRTDFPQVVLRDHVRENGVGLATDDEMKEGVCLECHNAHNPSE